MSVLFDQRNAFQSKISQAFVHDSVWTIRFFEWLDKKLLHIPKFIVSFLVFLVPWLSVLYAGIVLALSPLILFLSITAITGATFFSVLPSFIVSLLLIISAVLLFKAFPLLRKKQSKGWFLLFYTQCLSIIVGIVNMSQGDQSIWQILLTSVIGLYVLFEIRQRYS